MKSTRKTVLVTGCSSGFGKLAVPHFRARGWNVVATMRSPEQETELASSEDVLLTRLDVTDAASITAAVAAAVDRFGAIDVLVNNAGYGGRALFEQSGDAFVRSMYETNVFGLMACSRAVLPGMRAKGAGVIINVTAVAGMIGVPGNAIYSSTKWAVEGLSEAMAFEFEPLGVRVCAVAPGAYGTTRFGDNTTDSLDTGDAQLVAHSARLRAHVEAAIAANAGRTSDPREVVDVIYRCATERMPVHNPVGEDARHLEGMMAGRPRQDFLADMKGMLLP